MENNFKVGDKVRLSKKANDDIFMSPHVARFYNYNVDYKVQAISGNYIMVNGNPFLWHKHFFEKVEEKPIYIKDSIELKYGGEETIAKINGRIGKSYRNKCDKEDRKIGILIATMRALGFKKKTVDKVVDVLFDDLKEVDKCTTEELLKEIINRVK